MNHDVSQQLRQVLREALNESDVLLCHVLNCLEAMNVESGELVDRLNARIKANKLVLLGTEPQADLAA